MRYFLMLFVLLLSTSAFAQAPTRLCFSLVNGDTSNCVPVDNGNPLPTTATISGSITANSSGKATAADPSYVEGSTDVLSLTLSGYLRTMDLNSAAILAGVTGPIPAGTNTIGSIASITNALPAGTNILGKIGIDQTTDITTNGVEIAPTAATAAGTSAIASTVSESSHVLKGSPGNLYGAYATNQTATSGFLVILNSTTAPGDGAITPLDCIPLPGNSSASISRIPGPPRIYSTGITAVVTSGANCFTKTTGVISAFISGDVK